MREKICVCHVISGDEYREDIMCFERIDSGLSVRSGVHHRIQINSFE